MSTLFSGKPAGQTPHALNRLPRAVLWDMDGTLVETEPYWIETEYELAAEYGASWSQEQAMRLVGGALLDSGATIVREMGLPLTPVQVVDRLLDGVVSRVEREVPWRPGARELLHDLAAAGVPQGLVTMSWTRFVAPILAELPEGLFATVVTGDRVAHGKPHPEPYLMACRDLAVEPEDAVAIEDSATGVASAVAAGCPTLVVPNHVPVAPGPGRVFRDTLAGLTTADLEDIAVAGRRSTRL